MLKIHIMCVEYLSQSLFAFVFFVWVVVVRIDCSDQLSRDEVASLTYNSLLRVNVCVSACLVQVQVQLVLVIVALVRDVLIFFDANNELTTSSGRLFYTPTSMFKKKIILQDILFFLFASNQQGATL